MVPMHALLPVDAWINQLPKAMVCHNIAVEHGAEVHPHADASVVGYLRWRRIFSDSVVGPGW
jgi:hypothetical protein